MGEPRPDYVQSLERGLAVLRSFSREEPELTLSDVARRTNLSRATARRLLLTLLELGYVATDGRMFQLRPKVLDLGYAYLSSLAVAELAMPIMEDLSRVLKESSSAAVLDGTEIVYVARVAVNRIMSISLAVGSRLPAHATSMGRILLSGLPPDELDEYFERATLARLTDRTVVDEKRLRGILDEARERGWVLLDQELEDGVRSVAAPLCDGRGRAVAAMNVSAHAGRVDRQRMLDEFVPALVEGAAMVSRAISAR
ncbi:MAG TPA: IclR family transcriptional regulator C-terminal domain-containing protein [Candidatus Dormibacteraeota bacterium]